MNIEAHGHFCQRVSTRFWIRPVFSNDLFYFMSLCHLFNYADDNTITCCDTDLGVLLNKLEHDTIIAIDWFDRNFMKANPDKFRVMFLSPNNNVVFPDYISINGFNIDRHNVAKLLGVTIDDKLKFDKHVDTILCESIKAGQCNDYNSKVS